jgi:hypothetical protein
MRIGRVGRENVADKNVLFAKRRPCGRQVAVYVDGFGENGDRGVVLTQNTQREAEFKANFRPIRIGFDERREDFLRPFDVAFLPQRCSQKKLRFRIVRHIFQDRARKDFRLFGVTREEFSCSGNSACNRRTAFQRTFRDIMQFRHSLHYPNCRGLCGHEWSAAGMASPDVPRGRDISGRYGLPGPTLASAGPAARIL